MPEFTINVSEIEELQMTNDTVALNQIFARAQSAIVQGSVVSLARKNVDETIYKFDEITTEADMDTYRKTVLKYL